ncbi:Os06g0612951, partial [Oryza sativa Japonica Group]
TDEVAAELDVGALPSAVRLPRRRQPGLRPEAPHQPVHLQQQQVLQVRLLRSPVHAVAAAVHVQPHVVQRHLLQEPKPSAAAAAAFVSGDGGALERPVQHRPVELRRRRRRERHEVHPRRLVGGVEVVAVEVLLAPPPLRRRRRLQPRPHRVRRQLRGNVRALLRHRHRHHRHHHHHRRRRA